MAERPLQRGYAARAHVEYLVRPLRDRDELLAMLTPHRPYAAYAIGQLQPHLFTRSEWWVARGAQGQALFLSSHGGLGDALFALGPADALEAILYEDVARQLDILIHEPVADWSGPRGEVFRVHDGSMLLGGQPADGILLDVNRAHRPDDVPPGDWIFLEGGPSVTIVLEASKVPLMARTLAMARKGTLTRAWQATRRHLGEKLLLDPIDDVLANPGW